jgi:hypothetical protein
MNFAQCLRMVLVIGRHTDVFRGTFAGSEGSGLRGGSFHGVRDIAMKGVPDFPALFKKRSEIK